MKKPLLYCLFLISSIELHAQSVAINTDASAPSASAILDIKSITKGLLIPRMTTIQRTAITTPATGLMVFDITSNSFWFYNGTAWTQLSATGSSGWNLTGNAATNPANNFIGTTDAQPLRFRVNNVWAGALHPSSGNVFLGVNAGNTTSTGQDNTGMGEAALSANTSGSSNTAIGSAALKSNTSSSYNVAIGDSSLFSQNGSGSNTAVGTHTLFSNTTGNANTALGISAMQLNSIGNFNTAVGINALYNNISSNNNTAIGSSALQFNTGSFNTATGASALMSNTVGQWNTANGYLSLYNNTTGSFNTAYGQGSLYNNTTASYNTTNGYQSLYSNTTGFDNTANGYNSLYYNTTGNYNTANGAQSLLFNTTGNANTANGYSSLVLNTIGNNNTANGYQSLSSNTTGVNNTASGFQSLYSNSNGSANTAVGTFALFNNTSGTGNTVIGYNAGNDGTSSSDNTIIGAYASIAAGVRNSIVIGLGAFTNTPNLALLGNPSTAFTGGYTNWSNFSDGRFKKDIAENVKGLDFIMRLRPVTYHMDVRGLYDFWGVSAYGKPDSTNAGQRLAARVETDKSIQAKENIRMSGFVAQEVELAANASGYDFDGVIKPAHSKDHYRIAYAEFVVPLVKAMQEQQKIIEMLEKRLAALEAKK